MVTVMITPTPIVIIPASVVVIPTTMIAVTTGFLLRPSSLLGLATGAVSVEAVASGVLELQHKDGRYKRDSERFIRTNLARVAKTVQCVRRAMSMRGLVQTRDRTAYNVSCLSVCTPEGYSKANGAPGKSPKSRIWGKTRAEATVATIAVTK